MYRRALPRRVRTGLLLLFPLALRVDLVIEESRIARQRPPTRDLHGTAAVTLESAFSLVRARARTWVLRFDHVP